jgi:hypothetical protein
MIEYRSVRIGIPGKKTQIIDTMRWFVVGCLEDGGKDGVVRRIEELEGVNGIAMFLFYWQEALKKAKTTISLKEILELEGHDLFPSDSFPILLPPSASAEARAAWKQVDEDFHSRLAEPFSDAELIRLQILLLLAVSMEALFGLHKCKADPAKVIRDLHGEGDTIFAWGWVVESYLNAARIFMGAAELNDEQQSLDTRLRSRIDECMARWGPALRHEPDTHTIPRG